MLNPFIQLISGILDIYWWILIIWVIMSLLINFEVINRFNPYVKKIKHVLDRLTEPVLRPIRRFLQRIFGDLGGIDLSPIVVILLIRFIQSAMYSWLWNL